MAHGGCYILVTLILKDCVFHKTLLRACKVLASPLWSRIYGVIINCYCMVMGVVSNGNLNSRRHHFAIGWVIVLNLHVGFLLLENALHKNTLAGSF